MTLYPKHSDEYSDEYMSVAIYDESQQEFLACSDSTKNLDLANIWLTEILDSNVEYHNSAQLMYTDQISHNFLIDEPDTLH